MVTKTREICGGGDSSYDLAQDLESFVITDRTPWKQLLEPLDVLHGIYSPRYSQLERHVFYEGGKRFHSGTHIHPEGHDYQLCGKPEVPAHIFLGP